MRLVALIIFLIEWTQMELILRAKQWKYWWQVSTIKTKKDAPRCTDHFAYWMDTDGVHFWGVSNGNTDDRNPIPWVRNLIIWLDGLHFFWFTDLLIYWFIDLLIYDGRKGYLMETLQMSQMRTVWCCFHRSNFEFIATFPYNNTSQLQLNLWPAYLIAHISGGEWRRSECLACRNPFRSPSFNPTNVGDEIGRS
jgi:hypothetical protein